MVRRLNESSYMDDPATIEFDKKCTENEIYRRIKNTVGYFGYTVPRWMYWRNDYLDTVFRPSENNNPLKLIYRPTVYLKMRKGGDPEFSFETDEPAFFRSVEEVENMSITYKNVSKMVTSIEDLDLEKLEHYNY